MAEVEMKEKEADGSLQKPLQKPIISLSARGVRLAVWEHTANGKTKYTWNISRAIKVNGEWKDTPYMRDRDFLPALFLIQKAYGELLLHEEERKRKEAQKEAEAKRKDAEAFL